MDIHKPQQRWPVEIRMLPADWYQDPWDLTGKAEQERWWNGLIWTERIRQKTSSPVRDISKDSK